MGGLAAASMMLVFRPLVAVPLDSSLERDSPPAAPAHLLALLRSKTMLNPIVASDDPYLTWHDKEPPRTPAGTVCGLRFEADAIHYRVSTFANSLAARDARFAVTHVGACGTCSSLRDLAVYLERPDLTTPVRNCAMAWDAAASLRCLKELGFSTPCAQTWLYDALNTRRHCLAVCLWSFLKGEVSTGSDGRLNACLQCDEDLSGPVFKATAGRTRRNSGIRSSIPRSSDEIATITHDYVPDAGRR
jgi:hypothetical protein